MAGRRRVQARRAVAASSALAGLVAAAPCCYLAALSLAAFRPRAAPAAPVPDTRLVVLVPAHDEADLIGRCVATLLAQDYPGELRRVVVVADNCRDDTAAIARAAGAEVLVRDAPDAPGKGPALRWAMDRLLGSAEPVDAFVVVDADSVTDPGLLRGLTARLAPGVEVVQGEYLALEQEGAGAELRAAAFLLFHRVRFTGRDALGLPCSLVGNGMLLSRTVLERHPWHAYSSAEDLEYSVDLRLAGVRPAYAAQARLRAPVSSDRAGAQTQRLRWEGGRLHVARTRLPLLLRACAVEGRWSLWDAAVDLAVPPLGVLAAGVTAGGGAVLALELAGVVGLAAVAPWGLAGAALSVHVLAGLRAAGAPASTYRALLAAPGLVAGQLLARLSLLRDDRATTWERTARPSDLAARPDAGAATGRATR